jgi:hydrogenase maturation protein HypF
MASFAMCADCKAEYEDPLDRRFHAEPIACAVCGPRLRFLDANSQELPGDPIRLTVEQLRLGNILAIKGLGGYHLACDGLSESSIQRLRSRKYREDKPFALMGLSVEAIRPYCRITDIDAALLESPARPIVLLERELPSAIPGVAAPGVNTLGFMLPYAPQHYLLLEQFGGPLVMTSGNISEEPICYRDEEALQRLNRIADYFLVNDREILIRTDDSVARSHSDRPMLLRRSRG